MCLGELHRIQRGKDSARFADVNIHGVRRAEMRGERDVSRIPDTFIEQDWNVRVGAKLGHLMQFALFERLFDHANVEFFKVGKNAAGFAEAPTTIRIDSQGNAIANRFANSFDAREILRDAGADFYFEFAEAKLPSPTGDGGGLLRLAAGNRKFREHTITDRPAEQARNRSIQCFSEGIPT